MFGKKVKEEIPTVFQAPEIGGKQKRQSSGKANKLQFLKPTNFFITEQEQKKRASFRKLKPVIKHKYHSTHFEKYDEETNQMVYGATLRLVSYRKNREFIQNQLDDYLRDLNTKVSYYFDVEVIDPTNAVDGIIGQKTNNKAELQKKEQGGSENTYTEARQDNELDVLCTMITNDEIKVFKITLTIKVECESTDRLKEVTKQIVEDTKTRGFTVANNVFEQEQEHKNILTKASKYCHFFTQENLADFLPLYSNYSIDYDGFLMGYKMSNATPYFLNLRKAINKLSLVIASSGAGKSFAVKKMIMQAINSNMKVVIFDPKGKYRPFGDEYGKTYQFSRDFSIDIFKLKAPIEVKKRAVYEVLKTFIKEEFEPDLDIVVENYFNDTEESKNCWDTFLQYIKQEPFFKDLRRVVEGVEHKGIFNGSAELDFSAMINTVDLFDIKDTTSVAPLLIYLVNVLQSHIYNKDQDILMIIDEAYVLLQNKRSNRSLTNLAKIGRAYNTYLMFITQDLEDMEGEAIKLLNNATTKVFLSSESKQADLIGQYFNIGHESVQTIKNLGQGQAIIAQTSKSGIEVNQVQIHATEEEIDMFNF